MEKITTAKKILLQLLSSTSELLENMENMRHYQSAYIKGGAEYVNYIKKKENQRFKKELYRLKKQNFIKERRVGDKLYFCLTEKGKKSALKYKILKNEKKLKNRYCIVIFDIPESERKIRNFFRNFLKQADFIQLQQSVWVSDKDSVKELAELVRITGSEKWINIITADYISNFKFKTKKELSTKTDGRLKK